MATLRDGFVAPQTYHRSLNEDLGIVINCFGNWRDAVLPLVPLC